MMLASSVDWIALHCMHRKRDIAKEIVVVTFAPLSVSLRDGLLFITEKTVNI